MQVKIVNNYENLINKAFTILKKVINRNPYAVLGLSTDSSLSGLYKLMTDDCKNSNTSYKHIRTVNLVEYKGIHSTNKQSCASYMKKNLFEKLDINVEHTYIQNGMAVDDNAECQRYNEILEGLPRDIQILGLDRDSHIAFSDTYSSFGSLTHLVELSSETNGASKKAFTMGIKSIMQAKQVVILALGKNSAETVYKLVEGELTEKVPISVLQLHPFCTVLVDMEAASLLRKNN